MNALILIVSEMEAHGRHTLPETIVRPADGHGLQTGSASAPRLKPGSAASLTCTPDPTGGGDPSGGGSGDVWEICDYEAVFGENGDYLYTDFLGSHYAYEALLNIIAGVLSYV
jgi:hypothetical protein